MPRSSIKPAPTPAIAPAPSLWAQYRRLWVAAAVLVAGVVAYFATGAVVAYTDDAYVFSDLVAIAPEVTGIVKTVTVRDNQRLAVGDPIAVIDPEPYQLAVDLKQQQIASLEAAVAVKTQAQATDADSLDAAGSALRLAQEQYDRTKALAGAQDVSQADFDKAANALRDAQDRLAVRQNQVQIDAREITESKTKVAVARAELAVAQYSLSRTRLTAPVAGYVNNLTLRPGAYAHAGEAIVGIVDELRWRIVANFKEDIAASVAAGTAVWVWLDSSPWHFVSGHVQGVGRGIARNQGPVELLPYVSPTTDWIRLRRRLPVTILLDPTEPPPRLFMGADARVLFFR